MSILALAAGLLLAGTARADARATDDKPPGPALPRVVVYSGRLNLIEEIRSIPLAAGHSVVRVDFVRQNADLTTLDVQPLDHPDSVHVTAQTGRGDLPNALLLEIESDTARTERFRFSYAARGVSCSISYRFTLDPAARTLALVQELTATNASGEAFDAVALATVFGDVNTVNSNAVLHGRSAEPGKDAKPGLPAKPLWQDLAEHTAVSFGEPVPLPIDVTVTRRTLEKNAVPFQVDYRLDSNAGTTVKRIVKVANAKDAGLGGITLPPGAYLLREAEADLPPLRLGSGSLGHLPAGKTLELDAGRAPDMVVERELLDSQRTDLAFGEYNRALLTYTVEETHRVEVRNRSAEKRALRFTERVSGTDRFEVLEPSLPVSKKTRGTIEFRGEIPAWGTLELRYRVKKIAVKA